MTRMKKRRIQGLRLFKVENGVQSSKRIRSVIYLGRKYRKAQFEG